jgi:hypothetical protein
MRATTHCAIATLGQLSMSSSGWSGFKRNTARTTEKFKILKETPRDLKQYRMSFFRCRSRLAEVGSVVSSSRAYVTPHVGVGGLHNDRHVSMDSFWVSVTVFCAAFRRLIGIYLGSTDVSAMEK